MSTDDSTQGIDSAESKPAVDFPATETAPRSTATDKSQAFPAFQGFTALNIQFDDTTACGPEGCL